MSQEQKNINLVLITSVTNAQKDRSYYNSNERLEQLVKLTIPSIKKHIPNNYIVVLEGSSLTLDQHQQILQTEPQHIHHTPTANIDKSLGEVILLTDFFNSKHFLSIKDNIDNILKITGRYYLLDNFNFYSRIDENIIKRDNNRQVCETRYYKIIKSYIDNFKESLFNLKNRGIFWDLEHSFYQYNIVPCAHSMLTLSIGGNLGPDGTYIED